MKVIDREHPTWGEGVTEEIHRFENGYGASVVRGPGSYELAVILFHSDNNENFSRAYNTPITDNVVCHLTREDVNSILEKIEAL